MSNDNYLEFFSSREEEGCGEWEMQNEWIGLNKHPLVSAFN